MLVCARFLRMTTPAYASRLRDVVDAAEPQLLAIGDDTSARRPAPGKWSPREIIGHLIDSAGNNHGRFVRAGLGGDLVFEGYAQDGWVELQRYNDSPWRELVRLWAGYNRQLARTMAGIPEAVRMREHSRHNLHEVAWSPRSPDEPATLDWFMKDYVGHLEHHVRQVLGEGW